MDTPVVVPSGDRVRFRPSRAQQAPFLLFVAVDAFAVYQYIRSGMAALLIMPIVLTVEFLYLSFGVGVTLTAETAIVHNLRRRKIRWPDVQLIRVERYMGNRTIVIYEAGGRRTRLRAPISGFLYWDRGFEQKHDVIEQWWLGHRGGDWSPCALSAWAPQPVAADRRRLRPSAAQTGPIVLLFAWLCMDAAFGGLVAAPGAGPTALSRTIACLVMAVFVAAMWQFAVRAGATLTPEHLLVHNLRRRRFRWSEIASISVESRWTGSRLVIRGQDGRRTRMSGPRLGLFLWDRNFEEKARALDQWWRTNRQTTLQPVVAAAGSTASAAFDDPADQPACLPFAVPRGPRVWQKVLVVLACVVLGYELLVGLLVMALFAASRTFS